MKKILFATTALVATAGVASAEMSVSGSAELGVVGGDAYATSQPWTDVEVTFAGSVEAENGLSFGATVQLDEAPGPHATDDDGATWFIAFGPARLDAGDTDGAFDAAMYEVGGPGTIDDTETAYRGYTGNSGMDGIYDGQVVRFTYTFGGISAFLSTEVDDTSTYDSQYGIGLRYSGEFGGISLGAGIGMQEGDSDLADASVAATNAAFAALPPAPSSAQVLAAATHRLQSIAGVSFQIGVAGFTTTLGYSEGTYGDGSTFGNLETENSANIGIGYTINDVSIGLSYSQVDNLLGVEELSQNGYALSVNYPLATGLTLQAGYSDSTTEIDLAGVDDVDGDQFSIGLAMSF